MALSTSGRHATCGGYRACARPSRFLTVISAKGKGGGGGKKGSLAGLLQKKAEAEGGMEAGGRASRAQYAEPEVRGMLFSLITSYHKATGKFLLEDVELDSLPDAIFNAPFVCVAHDRAPGVDVPHYNYANRAGLECFDATWDEFVGMDSTKSTPPVDDDQEVRFKLLAEAESSSTGLAILPEGRRVTMNGEPIVIKNVTLFNVIDFSGDQVGQAAIFSEYVNKDGKTVKVKATAWQAAPPADLPPSEEEVAAAEAAVEEWGVYIRALKTDHGRGNKDADVVSAVGELKLRKEYLSALQKRVDDAIAANEAAFDNDEE
ncbi:hypothetical protein FOA52_005157 [Chlamydomonas sp. UWO 241]|nr:hypothetical protein FOA52_005157 [Chlamydomonas sp. UWO 241]